MGKLVTVGVPLAGVFGAFLVMGVLASMMAGPVTAVNGSGVVGATVDDKYAGLTDKEVQRVKIAKEYCDNNPAITSVQSETAGQLAYQRCLEQEQVRIDNYRATN